jgi:AcrR family transcriptional regulator
MSDGSRRPHTGRRRNDAARDAILDATFRLLSAPETVAVTIDAIAAEAGVGRQTIYRWWPSKGAVVADALARHAQVVVPERETGSFAGDLEAFFTDTFAGLENDSYAGRLRQIVAEAQRDEAVAQVLADFTATRRAALRALLERGRDAGELAPEADLDMLVDMAYGVLYYRLLVGHAPLDKQAARSLAAAVTGPASGLALRKAGRRLERRLDWRDRDQLPRVLPAALAVRQPRRAPADGLTSGKCRALIHPQGQLDSRGVVRGAEIAPVLRHEDVGRLSRGERDGCRLLGGHIGAAAASVAEWDGRAAGVIQCDLRVSADRTGS